jgi:hypothetical protein
MDLRGYRQAIINATKWLISQQQKDGSFIPADHGLATCHKVPYALALMGEEERAARLCGWIVEHLMDGEGDFSKLYPRMGALARYHVYPNAWLVAGAQKLGLFSLSFPASGFLLALQHPKSGGFLTAGPSAGLKDEQDLLGTATAGLACLHQGAYDAAVRAGDFLTWLLEAQPRGNVLFMAARYPEKIVSEGFEEADDLHYVLHMGRVGQLYASPALAALFLTKLGDALGNEDYVTAARFYLDFIEGGGDDRYTSIRSGFLGWAAAELYTVTGGQNYLRVATEVADNLLRQQLENGSWLQGSMSADLESDVVDGTAEHIIVLKGITKALTLGQ